MCTVHCSACRNNCGRPRARVGRSCLIWPMPNFGKVAECGPRSIEIGPKLVDTGQTWLMLVEFGPRLGAIVRNSDEFGRLRPRFGFGRLRPRFGQIRPGLGQSRVSSTGVGPMRNNSACIPRSCAALVLERHSTNPAPKTRPRQPQVTCERLAAWAPRDPLPHRSPQAPCDRGRRRRAGARRWPG